MARLSRIKIEEGGAYYHLCGRVAGIKGEYPLDSKRCRRQLVAFIKFFSRVYCVDILGFCIMSSHVHLVVKAGKEPLDRLMKGIHSGFAGWLNRKKGRKGAVFSERYKSILVEEEPYLIELVRYVHNNPVRARVTKTAKQSRWSSHRHYLGMHESPEWLNSGYVLSMFAKYPKVAREKFSQFVDEGKREKRRKDFSGERSGSAARKFQQAMGDG